MCCLKVRLLLRPRKYSKHEWLVNTIHITLPTELTAADTVNVSPFNSFLLPSSLIFVFSFSLFTQNGSATRE